MSDEPRPFHVFRYFLYLLIIIAYLFYSSYLIYNIVTDKPNLKVDQIFLNEIDVPDIVICGTSPELRILRCDLIANNGEKTPINGCNGYIPPNIIDYDIYRDHCLTFKANKTIKFVKPNSGMDGLQKIGFYFYDNTTAAEMNTLGIASLTIQLTPPDFNFNSLTNTNKAITAGSFIQEQTSEERSNTILSAIAAAGGAFGTMAGVIIFFFGDFRLNPRGAAHNFFNLVQKSKEFFERSRFYPKLELKFSKINDEDKASLVNEFRNIRYTIYYYLLNQSNIDKISKDHGWLINKLENKLKILYRKIYYWLLDEKHSEKIFRVYGKDREYYKFSSINEEDERLLNNEINKIRHVIDVYLYDKSKDPKKFAAYKYERELKFSDDTKNEDKELRIINEKDQKLLEAEFRKIRELIDKHLLGKPNIEEIFNTYNSLQKNGFLNDINDMDEGDKSLLNDLFQQISHVIFNYLLDIPKDEEIFKKYKETTTIQASSFSNNMNIGDKNLLVNEFNKIKHVINAHLFNGRKNLEVFEKYIKERELKFSNNMSEKDKKSLTDKFHKIREVIDNFLPIHTHVDFSVNMDSRDKELLISYINEIHKIRHDIDNCILNKV
ncbi:hypothetical protein RhiirA4_476963 [Rhizophagus irregularis]|uniref:Uncharacterized protein n=1 Tax=Rhizophagus irregularis TaxID=588596 RepID=A0A2I1HCI3_9GLOM|nr:hypothetical protein RhiirA4_476963 [Rhizophagus irregularis]